MKVGIGSDHAGFQLKARVLAELSKEDDCHDVGTGSEDAIDYPDVVLPLVGAVAAGEFDRGIFICGTGIGGSIAANKVAGIRAAVCHDCYSAQVSRTHNDANVLCLGSRVVGEELALEIVRIWIGAEFSGEERHVRRLSKTSRCERG